MRTTLIIAGVVAFGSRPAAAQFRPPASPTPASFPQPSFPAATPAGPAFVRPAEPRLLPPGVAPTPPPAAAPVVPLPYPEKKATVEPAALSLKRFTGSWQLWSGRTLFRDFGNAEVEAREAMRALRTMRVNEWVTIGGPAPVVEYGLSEGRAVTGAGFARLVLPIDLKTVRAEGVKGVWLLRDDDSVLFNFGPSRADAEQAAAAVRKYGFNRVGVVGTPTPAMSFLYRAVEGDVPPRNPLGPLGRYAQIEALSRTGIPTAGGGYVGEMVLFDWRKAEVRRDGAEWVVAHGTDVFGRFGAGEWQARDALKVVQDGHFTAWCRLGTATFFLVDGRAPTRVPFAVQARTYSPADLRVANGPRGWTLTEGGRPLFDAASAEEGEQLAALLKHYRFDQLCRSGPTPRASLTFLAKCR